MEIEGDFGEAGKTCLSLRLLPELSPNPKSVRQLTDATAADRWKTNGPKEYRISCKTSADGLLVEIEKGQTKEQWSQLTLELTPKERPDEREIALMLLMDTLEGEAKLAVEFVEEQGPSFSVPYAKPEAADKAQAVAVALGHALTPSWSSEPERAVDPGAIRSIRIRCDEMKGDKLRLLVKGVGWAQY